MTHRAKKSLGQNFLKSEPALKKIIEAGEIKKGEIILEIGPGKGVLTERLLETGGKVIAVEKDWELFELLKIKFAEAIKLRSLVLVHGDILDFNPRTYNLARKSQGALSGRTYKVIANIPYNITGAILKKFLTAENQPESMVLMVQKEVAERIIARGGKESILSISVKAYGEPKMLMKVPARYFTPSPKVDSAIILINHISKKLFIDNLEPVKSRTLDNKDAKDFEEKFWEIVKKGFAHKRKKLSSNLKTLENGRLASVLDLGNKRAEDLKISDWILLAKK